MAQSGEYITDESILNEAREAKELYDSAQDKLTTALWLAYYMAKMPPAHALGTYPFAKAIAELGAEQANEFKEITGESMVVDPQEVGKVRAELREDLKLHSR